MNLLLFSAEDRLDRQRIQIRDGRLRHLQQVHRATVGDTLRVGEIDGLMGTGEILTLERDSATLEVSLSDQPPAKLPITLVVALPRPKMLRRILRTTAEMGAQALHLIHSYRVEKSYWQTPVLSHQTLNGYLLEGLSQARDTRLPPVVLHQRFKPFVEDTLPTLLESTTGLVAHPGDYPTLPDTLQQPHLFVIGPEGGFIPYELELLETVGCTPVKMGKRILRVENAVTTVLGRYQI